MADAYVTQFTELKRMRSHTFAPIVQYPPLVNEKVTFTTTTANAAAFVEGTRILLIQCEVECFYEVGETPVADADSIYLPAAIKERYIGVKPGDKIAFWDGSS